MWSHIAYEMPWLRPEFKDPLRSLLCCVIQSPTRKTHKFCTGARLAIKLWVLNFRWWDPLAVYNHYRQLNQRKFWIQSLTCCISMAPPIRALKRDTSAGLCVLFLPRAELRQRKVEKPELPIDIMNTISEAGMLMCLDFSAIKPYKYASRIFSYFLGCSRKQLESGLDSHYLIKLPLRTFRNWAWRAIWR